MKLGHFTGMMIPQIHDRKDRMMVMLTS